MPSSRHVEELVPQGYLRAACATRPGEERGEVGEEKQIGPKGREGEEEGGRGGMSVEEGKETRRFL